MRTKVQKNQKNEILKGEPVYNLSLENARVTLSAKNTKIGNIINWSTLPGNSEHRLTLNGRTLSNVEGTCTSNCGECFKTCYAKKSATLHHNCVIKAWGENTLFLRHKMDECFRQIDAQINELNKKYFKTHDKNDLKYKCFRINVSGELQSLEELEHWNELAKKHPELKFGVYTKNSIVVLAFFKRWGQTADNFCINISEWHGVMKETIAELHKIGAIFNVFEYDDSNRRDCTLSAQQKQELSARPHCPAVGATKENKHPINPKTGEVWHCNECRGCYTKTGIHRCVYSH